MDRPFLPPSFALAVALATPWLAACDRGGAASVRTLPSGLRVAEFKEGAGALAEEGSWVEIHYDARFGADEARARASPPFDSTRGGDPFLFRIGRSRVLPAFAGGVAGMREGGRRKLSLPPAIAYGSLGKGAIPADATLDYDVELVHVFARSKQGVDFLERKHGSGAHPVAGQRVVLRCRAWLVETGRSILDAKRSRDGFVVEVGAGQAIPALDAVLPEMTVGSSWRLGVPPELGYGSGGRVPILVVGQDVVLDVDLVSIQDKP